jgi:hypothetical protein
MKRIVILHRSDRIVRLCNEDGRATVSPTCPAKIFDGRDEASMTTQRALHHKQILAALLDHACVIASSAGTRMRAQQFQGAFRVNIDSVLTRAQAPR